MQQREDAEKEYHVPVMIREAIEMLHVEPNGVYVDATLGGGGYSERILQHLAQSGAGKVFGFDTDPAAMEFATKRLASFGAHFELVPENFREIKRELEARNVFSINGIVYDLGVSSHQLDTDSVGLSYRIDAPLDMRLDPRLPVTAADLINSEEEGTLKRIFYRYGEEPFSGPIARKVIEARKHAPITTTRALAEIITRGIREDKKNATLSRIFQALRIEVNRELENLKVSLEAAISLLQKGGRIVVVSYHSLEDRIVKDLFQECSAPKAEPGSPTYLKETIDKSKATLQLLQKKPFLPSEEEIEMNPRARSAKMRVAEKL